MKLGDIEFIYSDRRNRVHRQGVRVMFNKDASKCCLGWESKTD